MTSANLTLDTAKPVQQPALIENELTFNDLIEGLSQLSIIGVIEMTFIIEAMHREIALRPYGLFNEKYSRLWGKGISGRVYYIVRGTTLLVGKGLGFTLRQYGQLKQHQPLSAPLKLLVDVINGVMGDHLVVKKNPLALPMTLYTIEGQSLSVLLSETAPLPINPSDEKKPLQVNQDSNTLKHNLSKPNNHNQTTVTNDPLPCAEADRLSGHVVIIAHGLCMGYSNWKPFSDTGLGRKVLQKLPQTTVLYLNYNTGQRVSTNGHRFSALLQQLILQHPDIDRIDLVGHSMGGLVSRSALYYGTKNGNQWPQIVNKLVTLGTPHHGAILERMGDHVQQTLSSLPFAGAIATLGDIRSLGIIDLRHGSVRDEDWHELETRSVLPDTHRQITPLPQHIVTYCLAATLANSRSKSSASRMLGDGLVSIESALGEHTQEHTLDVPQARKAVIYELSHIGILTDPKVHRQVVSWLAE